MSTFRHGAPAFDFASSIVAILAHSIWLGAACAVLLYLLLRTVPAVFARTRYALSCLALALVVFGCGMMWFAGGLFSPPIQITPHHPPSVTALTHLPVTAAAQSTSPDTGASSKAESPLHIVIASAPDSAGNRALEIPQLPPRPTWVSLCLAAWLAGVSVMLIRLAFSLGGALRARRNATPVNSAEINGLVSELCLWFGIVRPVTVVISQVLSTPAVMGAFWPTILLPANWLTGLPPHLLKAVLAHELAHVRRHDYLVNLLQMLIEAVLFFNPAIWWISCQVRIEREACCDALALACTNEPAAYAQALALAAEFASSARGAAPYPKAALAATGPTPGGLPDRIRRIFNPNSRPTPRMPWYSIGLAIAALSLALATTLGSVTFAAKALTPQERIQQLEQVQRTHGVLYDPKGDGFEPPQTTVTGHVLLPPGFHGHREINGSLTSPRFGSGLGYPVGEDGTFTGKIHVGSAWFYTNIDGFAPTFLGPLQVRDGKVLDLGDIPITPGFTAKIRLVSNDNPVSGAAVILSYPQPATNMSTDQRTLTTGSDGIVTLVHLPHHPIKLAVTAPGIEPAWREFDQLPHEGTVDWPLRKSAAVRGKVVDSQTSKPVAGTNLILFRSSGPDGEHGHNYRNAKPVATSDAEGGFTLDQLRKDTKYTYMIIAPGHTNQWLQDVGANQKEITIVLGAPLILEGTVLGDVRRLPPADYSDRQSSPSLSLSNLISVPGSHSSEYPLAQLPLEQRGPEVYHFYCDTLFPTQARLEAGGYDVVYEFNPLTESHRDLVFDLRPEALAARHQRELENFTTRAVVLRFQVPEGSPLPTGNVMLNYSKSPRDPDRGVVKPVPLTAPEMPLVSVVPGRIDLEPGTMVGYWFKRVYQEITTGTGPLIIKIECLPAGSIFGQITEESGKPASQAYLSIQAESLPGGMSSGELNMNHIDVTSDGHFNITPLPLGGTYTIRASRRANFVNSDPISIDEKRPAKDVLLHLPVGQHVTGRVVNADHLPLAGIPVSLICRTDGNWTLESEVPVSDVNGYFDAGKANPKAPGTYYVKLTPEKQYAAEVIKVTPSATPLEIALKPGEIASGRVITDSGQPVAGAEVFASPVDTSRWSKEPVFNISAESKTDENGRFRFSNLSADRVYFFYVKGVMMKTATRAKSADATNLTLTVSYYPNSGGRVTDY